MTVHRSPTGQFSDAAGTVGHRVGLPSSRAVVGGLLVAVAACGTFLAYDGANRDDRIGVLVAARPLAIGETLAADDLELVLVDVPGSVRGLFGDVDAAIGRQVTASVAPGEFLLASATAPAIEADSLELSVQLPSSRAVGRLRPGERVDAFATWSSTVTELIAVDARVLEVSGGTGGGSFGADFVTIRLALGDLAQVEAMVHAQAAGDLTLVRAAIGSEHGSIGRQFRPGARADASAGGER